MDKKIPKSSFCYYRLKNIVVEMLNTQTNIQRKEVTILDVLDCIHDWEIRIRKIIGESNE